MRWWPLALLIASAYFLGPDIYQRAMIPPPPSSEQVISEPAQKTTLIEWLKQAQQERDQAIVERNSAQNSWAADLKKMEAIQSQLVATTRQLDNTKSQLQDSSHQLEVARQAAHVPPPPPPPEDQIPINWDRNFYMQFLGAPPGSEPKLQMLQFRGRATSLASIKDGYILPPYPVKAGRAAPLS